MDADRLDVEIAARFRQAYSFLERLVATPSAVGREHEAQDVVEQELKRLGLDVERLAISEGVADDSLAGVPQTVYEGRGDLVGRLGADTGVSLLINGHVDV